MPNITVTFDDLEPATFDVSPPSDMQAFFVFGLHKAGSSLLNKIFKKLCRTTGVADMSLSEQLFLQGHSDVPLQTCNNLGSLLVDGYCHRGFRTLPTQLAALEIFRERRKVLLVRDPRDAIVSAYFSFIKGSHRLPESGPLRQSMEASRAENSDLSIDEYSRRAAHGYAASMGVYHQALRGLANSKIYRYEDVIFEKQTWIRDMLNFIEMDAPSAVVDAVVRDVDVLPTVEDPKAHIRRVTPGDHKEKLQKETIDYMTEVLSDEMLYFGYPTVTEA